MEGFEIFEEQNELEFIIRFSDKDICYAYLAHH